MMLFSPFELFYSHMNDVVSCVVHALENDQIKGLEYSMRGSTAMTFDGILELLAKHCGRASYTKARRSIITGYIEKFMIGRTHDKNMMKMLEWHEAEPQNFMNDSNYFEKFKIKETTDLKTTYAEGKGKSDYYIEPYLYQYKRIALD